MPIEALGVFSIQKDSALSMVMLSANNGSRNEVEGTDSGNKSVQGIFQSVMSIEMVMGENFG